MQLPCQRLFPAASCNLLNLKEKKTKPWCYGEHIGEVVPDSANYDNFCAMHGEMTHVRCHCHPAAQPLTLRGREKLARVMVKC